MRIASRQNSYSYHAKNSAIGGGVSLKSGGVSLSKDQRDYSLRTVAEQAGIFAGNDGLKVTVKGKTTLVGAVIDSQGKKEKNQVTTGDLELKDMDNVASLSNKGGGVSYQTGQGTKVNEQGLTPMPMIGVDSKTKSKTYAAIVDGKLEITGNKKIKVEDINRNTQHTLNALENSLNLRKLEERKRLSTLFAKHANEAIHVISEKNKWNEGSPEKVLLHAFVGGMTAQMGGDTVLAGAIPGAVNEIFSGALKRYEAKHGPISPDQRQWLALVGGVTTNYATGHTLQTGGAVAAYGTKHNLLAKPDDEVWIIIYENLFQGNRDNVVGHSAFVIGNPTDGYTEVGFGPQPLWSVLSSFDNGKDGGFAQELKSIYLPGEITEIQHREEDFTKLITTKKSKTISLKSAKRRNSKTY